MVNETMAKRISTGGHGKRNTGSMSLGSNSHGSKIHIKLASSIAANTEILSSKDTGNHIQTIAERSMQNDRRGQKSRNLFAVEAYNRRFKERRHNKSA